MPRRRMIDPQIWRNEKVGSLSDAGRLLFIGIFSQADDDGRLKASPRFLMASIFPYDKDKTEEEIGQLRDQCVGLGLIRLYNNGKEEYLDLPGWHEHQEIRKDRYTPSKLPSIDDAVETSPLNQPITFGYRPPTRGYAREEHAAQHTLAQQLQANQWQPTGEKIIRVETNKRLGNLYADLVAITETQKYILIEVKMYPLQPKDLGQVLGYRREMESRQLTPITTFLISGSLGKLTTEEATQSSVKILNFRDLRVATTNQSVQSTVATTAQPNIIKSSLIKSKHEALPNGKAGGKPPDNAPELFDLWNSLGIIKHRSLTGDMTRAIKAASRDFSAAEISQAMRNYAQIVNDEQCYFKYKWRLQDFLKRGLEKFLDLEVALNNYRKKGGADGADGKGVKDKRGKVHTREDFSGRSW